MVSGIELSEVETAAVLIEALYILIEPYVLTTDRRDAFRLEADLLDRIL